jgi:hypothetical protein
VPAVGVPDVVAVMRAPWTRGVSNNRGTQASGTQRSAIDC